MFAAGAAAYVARRGHAEAGAIFIALRSASGVRLFAPAPMSDATQGDRAWSERPLASADQEAGLATLIERELRFDPDIWVIEVEDREGRDFLGDALVPG